LIIRGNQVKKGGALSEERLCFGHENKHILVFKFEPKIIKNKGSKLKKLILQNELSVKSQIEQSCESSACWELPRFLPKCFGAFSSFRCSKKWEERTPNEITSIPTNKKLYMFRFLTIQLAKV